MCTQDKPLAHRCGGVVAHGGTHPKEGRRGLGRGNTPAVLPRGGALEKLSRRDRCQFSLESTVIGEALWHYSPHTRLLYGGSSLPQPSRR